MLLREDVSDISFTNILCLLESSVGFILYILYYNILYKSYKERKGVPTLGATLCFILGLQLYA